MATDNERPASAARRPDSASHAKRSREDRESALAARDVAVHFGQLCLRDGAVLEQKRKYRGAHAAYSKAVTMVSSVARDDPRAHTEWTAATAHLGVARVALALGHVDEARTAATVASEAATGYSTSAPNPAATAVVRRAMDHARIGVPFEYAALALEAVEVEAQAFDKAGEPELALVSWSRAAHAAELINGAERASASTNARRSAQDIVSKLGFSGRGMVDSASKELQTGSGGASPSARSRGAHTPISTPLSTSTAQKRRMQRPASAPISPTKRPAKTTTKQLAATEPPRDGRDPFAVASARKSRVGSAKTATAVAREQKRNVAPTVMRNLADKEIPTPYSSGLRQYLADGRTIAFALSELSAAARRGDAAHVARLSRAALLRVPSLHLADRAYAGAVCLVAHAAAALMLGAQPGDVRASVRHAKELATSADYETVADCAERVERATARHVSASVAKTLAQDALRNLFVTPAASRKRGELPM